MKEEEHGRVEWYISTGTMVRVLLVIFLAGILWYLRDIFLVVVTAIVLASAIEPSIGFFTRKGVPRLAALVGVYVIGFGFLAGLVYFFVPALFADMSALVRALPDIADAPFISSPMTENIAAGVNNALGEGIREGANILEVARGRVTEGGAINAAALLFGGLLSFIFVVVLSFYLAAQERGIENFLRLITPLSSRGYVISLWKRSQEKIGQWFQGQLLLGVLVGVLTFLGLSILGVSSALLLAVLAMVFEIIPVFGPILAAVPAVAIAFTEGIRVADPGMTAALIVVAFYFIVQQFESHLIYPLVVRKVVGIPPVLVILALLIGAKLAGFIGILLAVPLAAVLVEFLNDVARERKIFEDT